MTKGMRGLDPGPIQTLFGAGSVGSMTEGQLLEQFLARQDETADAAFAALVALHGPMVWNVCRGILADRQMAEDAFQATFVVLARKAGSIRRRGSVGPWLYGVARRIAVRAKTSAARRRLHETRGSDNMTALAGPDPSREEQFEALHEEVDRLPEKYRAPVVLCHFEGRTHAEAASLLRCPVGTVGIRLARARERLRARLVRRGFALSALVAGSLAGSDAWATAVPAGLAETTIKAALPLAMGQALTAGTVPAAVARLASGELKSMILIKLAVAAGGVLAAGLVAAGISLFAADEPPPRPAPAGVPRQDEAAARSRDLDNLKMLGIVLGGARRSPQDRYRPAAIRKDGKALLSWRVAILPLIGQKALYDRFHLDEPWDSPHNQALLREMPALYAPVVDKGQPPFTTHYQVIVGPGTLFEANDGTLRSDAKDEWTIAIVEGAAPVPWTKPEDLAYDPEKPLPKLGGQFEDGAYCIFKDGGALYLSHKIEPEILRALITRSGGEVISFDQLHPDKERSFPQRGKKDETK